MGTRANPAEEVAPAQPRRTGPVRPPNMDDRLPAAVQWVEANRSRPPVSRPQYLKVETTNVCNADCAFCLYGRMARPKGTMPMDLYRKVIDEYVEAGGGALTLSPLVGDCFCDRHFLDRLRYCRTYDEITHVGFHTNLIALDRYSDDELLEMLDLIDVFNCSIGPNRDVYHDMFGVDRFERVAANLERLHRVVQQAPYPPLVQVNGRACAGAFDVDARIERFGSALNGGEVKWKTSYADWGGLLDELPHDTPVARVAERSRPCLPCKSGLNSAVVFWDGRVGFCGCADSDALLLIGDVRAEPLGSILSGAPRRRFIASFLNGALHPYCRRCTFYAPMKPDEIANWIEGTNPNHPDPVRPSSQRGRTRQAVGTHDQGGTP
jgi:hypothetical protein